MPIMSSDSTLVTQRALSNHERCAAICAHCYSLLERPDEAAADSTIVVCDRMTIYKSVQSGCRICQRFLEHWLYFRGSISNTCLLQKRVLWLTENNATRPCTLTLSMLGEQTDTDEIFLGLMPIHKESGRAVQEFGQEEYGGIHTLPIVTALPCRSTRDQKCMERIQAWTKLCLRKHRDCNTRANMSRKSADYLPARLLSVDSRYQLQLIETNKSAHLEKYRYATLTHRWQQSTGFKLLRSNLNLWTRRIAILSLPPVFRDAVRLCRSLDIPYLWIDALCIVQDDTTDKAREISRMGHIYENAYLNIGATAAAQVDARRSDGLFVDRHKFAESNDFLLLQVRRSDYNDHHYLQQTTAGSRLNYSNLMSRGWVIQERLLSPRSVYCGQQLEWECCELLAREYYPDGEASQFNYSYWGHGRPFKMRCMLKDNSLGYTGGDLLAKKYETWIYLIWMFRRCDLTYPSDCLPALSGLAKNFSREMDDEYLAGLWRKDLFRELLWYHDLNPRYNTSMGTSPEEYRGRCCHSETVEQTLTPRGAPTWSWASKNIRVNFIFFGLSFPLSEVRRTCVVEDVAVDLVGSDPTGNVTGGYIRLKAPMRTTKQRMHRWRYHRAAPGYEWYDEGYDASGHRRAGGTCHLLMGFTIKHEEGGPERQSLDRPARYLGLIIKAVGGEPDVYQRIGAFCHPYGTWESKQHWPEPEFGECAEFEGFDPNNYQRHTITII